MNRYLGTFYNKNITDAHPKGDVIQVEITPSSGTYDDTIDLDFPFDEPVIITQESDGIFSPLKTQGCTISIFTEEIFWELYASNPLQWVVTVSKLDDDGTIAFTYFKGFLTPCAYSQDYAYNGVLELEAVDMIAALENIDYEVMTSPKRAAIAIPTIIDSIFSKIPFYVASSTTYTTKYDWVNYKLQEANFFDDDDEETPWKCKEVLEEICKYFGVTASMYDGTLYITDYSYDTDSTITMSTDDYADGTPQVSLDEVYNKVSISCSLYEIENIAPKIFADENYHSLVNIVKCANESLTTGSYIYHRLQQGDDFFITKPYTLIRENECFLKYADFKAQKWVDRHWASLGYSSDKGGVEPAVLTLEPAVGERISHTYGLIVDSKNKPLPSPYYEGAYPFRQYVTQKKDIRQETASWEEHIYMPLYRDRDAWTVPCDADRVAIDFTNPDTISYTPAEGTGYIVLPISLKFVSGVGSWVKASHYIVTPYYASIKDVDKTQGDADYRFLERGYEKYGTLSEWNTGFPVLKCMLRIGSYYWAGSYWSTAPLTFDIRFHDEDVSGKDDEDDFEGITTNTDLKIANSPAAPAVTGEEGYCIPIHSYQQINGDFYFAIYTPYGVNCTKSWDYYKYTPNNKKKTVYTKGDVKYWNVDNSGIVYEDFEIKYVYKDTSHWADDRPENSDIVYELEDETNPLGNEYDDLELKINSWYMGDSMSKSFILDSDLVPVKTINDKIQENYLCEKYLTHYKTPKIIFNVPYHIDALSPRVKFYYPYPAINKTFMLDSYELDLKSYKTTLNLIEI